MVLPVKGHGRVLPAEMAHFDNVVLGQEAVSKLPNGPTYEILVLETNVPPAGIESVVLDMGGSYNRGEVINVSGADLLMMWKYKGLTDIHGTGPVYFYPIPLASIEANTELGEQFSGLVTLSSDNNQLKVRINAGAQPKDGAGNAAAPTMKVHAWASAARAVRKFIPVIKSQTVQNNATDVYDHPNLPATVGTYYRRLYLHGPVDQVEIKKDDVNRWPPTEKATAELQQTWFGRKPVPGIFVVDFCPEGYVFRDLFNPLHRKQLLLKMRMTAAQNVRILYESVQELNPYESAAGHVAQGA